MEEKFKIPVTPTGAHERVRLKRDDGGIVLSGTIVRYGFITGEFDAVLDVQKMGDQPVTFTPQTPRKFTDSVFGMTWHLV